MKAKDIPDDYVKIADHQCPICGTIHKHDTELLIHKNLKSIETDDDGIVVTGMSLCEEHDKLFKEGYVALIVVNPPENLNDVSHEEKLSLIDAERTGDLCHVRRSVFNDMMNANIEDNTPLIFIDPELFQKLVAMEQTASTGH